MRARCANSPRTWRKGPLGTKPPQRHPVRDGRHAELAHLEREVVAALARALTSRDPDHIVRFDPVRSAEPPKSSGSIGARPSRAFCELLRVRPSRPWHCLLDECPQHVLAPARRQLARHAALELRGEVRKSGGGRARTARSTPTPPPHRSRARPTPRRRCAAPRTADAASRSRRGSPQSPPCRAARRASWVFTLRRRTLGDQRLAADEARPALLELRRLDRGVDRLHVVPVDVRDDVPPVRLEALRGVVGEPVPDVAVDRNAVVVVEDDQLVQAERARGASRPRARSSMRQPSPTNA